MKKNEFVQIKGLDLKELRTKAKTLRGKIADLVLDKNMKKLKDLKSISKAKIELAKILTVIGQKELLVQLESKVKTQDSVKEVKAGKEKTSH